ncbi:EscU/YscU/HrcU family type III secretion system export apparatus switch protein [Orenia marismortui]|uniref:Flagellar biosynthesis protein n=1 Tax=Orenia marismortui TaxID=46469 RepID=A0A4V3GYI0_9FIRM|nr:EscU/YscU/HrcU family type III secretion system export apparatus switch protein [Orenia marismortui]TDX52755.1 flagellar biosynthesis protein [Orenia marismortui]
MENEKTRKAEAVAIRYNSEIDYAPTVIAKGKGDLAKKIIEKAKECDIPLKEDNDLVKVLLQLELGEEIPEDLYKVVAEILAFIYELEDLS